MSMKRGKMPSDCQSKNMNIVRWWAFRKTFSLIHCGFNGPRKRIQK
jgi:hypothetical protein